MQKIWGHRVSKVSLKLSKKIWDPCNENRCCISAEHIPVSHNVAADFMSKTSNEDT